MNKQSKDNIAVDLRFLAPLAGLEPAVSAPSLISWSHPGRFRSEAAFAMLAGGAPVQASSGQVVRHRLNRGGDRR
jgi:transposase